MRGPVPCRVLGDGLPGRRTPRNLEHRPPRPPAEPTKSAPWSAHRYNASRGDAQTIARSRWALWKNPEDLTVKQTAQLAWIAISSPRLHRAYLLKEGLRHVFKLGGDAGKHALQTWLAWASRCRIGVFVELGRRIRRHLAAIHATLDHGLIERPDRSSQHQDPPHHPHRLRLQRPPRPHRPRHAHPRRLPTTTPRPKLTHTCTEEPDNPSNIRPDRSNSRPDRGIHQPADPAEAAAHHLAEHAHRQMERR